MLARLRPRLTYANVVSTICLCLVVGGGSAYAANTVFSSDIVDGEVKTPDLANEAVSGPKLKPGAVGTDRLAGGAVTTDKVKDSTLAGRDVLDNSLRGADIDESTLTNIGGGGPAGGDLTGTYPNPLIAPDAVGSAEVAGNSLTGNDIDESTLGQVPSALLGGIGRSRSPFGDCNPDEESYITCAFTTIDLPEQTRVLVLATVRSKNEGGSGGATGQCRLATNLGSLGVLSIFITVEDEFVPLIGSTLVGPGTVDFGIQCNEMDGAIAYDFAQVAAVALSPN